MPPLSRTERAALAELLAQLGPDAPTLAEGWTTRDLAAHLVVRERRPDATPGIAVRLLSGHMESVRSRAAKRPYDELVADVRDGPPRWSPFALPAVDRLLNGVEYFVHHEDVRRAQPGSFPRVLPESVQEALWRATTARAALALRGLGCGVLLVRPDGRQHAIGDEENAVVLTGEPQELLLYLYGRGAHTDVTVSGPEEAQRRLQATSLAV